MSVTDATALFEARRRRRTADAGIAIWEVVMVENMTIADLRQRLRCTGLVIAERHGVLVLAAPPEPPPAA